MLSVSFGRDKNNLQRRRFETDEILLGRSSEADLQFTADDAVSSRHCRVFLENGACWVEDLKSSHGVELAGQLVNRAPLTLGMTFWIGNIWVRIDGYAQASPEQVSSTLPETEVLDRRTLRPTSPAPAPPVETSTPRKPAPGRRKDRADKISGEPPPLRERQVSETRAPGVKPSQPGPAKGVPMERPAGERPNEKVRAVIAWWRQGAGSFMDLILRREPVRERDIAEDARRWDAIGRPAWFHSHEWKLRDASTASILVAEYVGDSRRTMGAQRAARLWLGAVVVLLSASSFVGAQIALPPLNVQGTPGAAQSACAQDGKLAESNQRAESLDDLDPESAVWRALYALEPIARSPSCMHRSRAEGALREALTRLQSTVLMRPSNPIRQVAALDDRYAIALDKAGRLHWADRLGQHPPRALPGLPRDIKVFAVSPDGRRLATGTADGQLVLWEFRSPGDPVRRNTVPAHRQEVSALAFSSDGHWLASADADGDIQLRSAGESISERAHQHFTAPAKIEKLGVHAETDTLFAIGGYRAFAWTWSGEVTVRPAELRMSSPISALALSADASSVIAGSSDGTIHLWSAPHGPRSLRRITSTGAKIQAIAASSVVPRVALSIGEDGNLWCTKLDSGEVRKGEVPRSRGETGIDTAVDLLLVSRDGKQALARVPSGKLYSWDLTDCREITPKDLSRLDDSATEISLADDGSWALGGDSHTLRAWDLLSMGAGAKSVFAHPGGVTALAVSSDRMLLVTAGRDQQLRLWRLSPAGVPTLQHTFPVDAPIRALALDEAGQTAAVASGSLLLIWDLTQCTTPRQCSKVEKHELSQVTSRSLLTRLAMSQDGEWVVAGDEAGRVATWSRGPDGFERSSATAELEGAIRSLAIDPVRRVVAAGTSRGDLWAWPLDRSRDPKRVSLSPGKTIRDLAFNDSPDGGILAGVDDFTLYEVPLATSGELATSAAEGRRSYPHGEAVLSVAALGGRIASGSADGQIHLRLGKQEPHPLRGLTEKLARLQLSRDAELLVASDRNGFLTLWPLSENPDPSHLQIHAHQGPINAFALDKRGEFIITGGDEGNIRVWPLSPARLIEHACSVIGSTHPSEPRTTLCDGT